MHSLSKLDIFVHASSILISLFFDDNYYCSVASRARYIILVNVRFIGKLACPVNYNNIIHQVGSRSGPCQRNNLTACFFYISITYHWDTEIRKTAQI